MKLRTRRNPTNLEPAAVLAGAAGSQRGRVRMHAQNSLGRLAAAGAVIALAVVAAGSFPAQAQPARDPGLIVAARFSDANDGNPQLVAVNPQTGAAEVLTSGNQDGVPDLSPNGRTVVFERCVNAADCDQVGKINVWVMRTDGSSAHPLTTCDGTSCLGAFDPAFSSDGRYITFAQDLLDDQGVNFNGIFIMKADGTHARRVTHQGPDSLPDGAPQFSPDGRHLVFHRELADGTHQLFTVGVDGTGLHELLPGVDGSAPSWSPDGRRIAFTLVRHDGDSTRFYVATVHPNGTGLTLVTNNPPGEGSFAPDFSPDATKVVYSHANAIGCKLVITRPSGRDRHELPGEGCFVDASWGPLARHG